MDHIDYLPSQVVREFLRNLSFEGGKFGVIAVTVSEDHSDVMRFLSRN